ncbi:hypothetical protein [Sulfobacillus thermotolerans]|uniref:hypothetical protein n=1 Tax=Sulfobacillus thermotolerans TaxID=338644 RepID=UPI003367312A
MQVSPHIVIPTENGVARTSTYRTLIHSKFFVIYWTGSTLVLLALQFVSISLAWFVLKTTGSSVRVHHLSSHPDCPYGHQPVHRPITRPTTTSTFDGDR